MAQTEVSPKFAAFLDAVKAQMDPELWAQTQASLIRRHDTPPLEALEAVLRVRLSQEKARQLLFYPQPEDMSFYPALIANPPAGAPDGHPQAKAQIIGLMSLYMVHRASWALMRPFIAAGGLAVLVETLASPNLYLASQAMSILESITQEEMYPWHDPPATPDGRGPKDGPDAPIWRAMHALHATPLVHNLLSLHHPDTFPGSGFMALRTFAFYASWLRLHFTPDRCLRLSRGLLDLLASWAADERCGAEERELAKNLHEDFGRFPPADAEPAAATGLSNLSLGSGISGMEDNGEEEGTGVVAERTVIVPEEPNEAEALKEAGNAAFKARDYGAAIAKYSAALDSLVPQQRLLTEGPRRAVYHVNRAASYLARAAAGLRPSDMADTAGLLESLDHGHSSALSRHYEAALMDCDSALALDPHNVKAYLRRAQALQALGRLPDALAAAEKGLAEATAGGSSSASSPIVAEMGAIERQLQQQLELQAKAASYSIEDMD